MKKTFLFFTVFFFFGISSAEEVQVGEYKIEDVTITLFEEKKSEPESEKAAEVGDREEELNDTVEPKKYYIQPAVGIETGNISFALLFNLDIDFLVAQTKRKNNISLGFDVGIVYAPLDYFFKFPIMGNITFDFKQNDPNLKYVSYWMSLGVDLAFWSYRESAGWLGASVAWRTGLSIVFRNDMVIKVGLDSSPVTEGYYDHHMRGLYLSLMAALGYRF